MATVLPIVPGTGWGTGAGKTTTKTSTRRSKEEIAMLTKAGREVLPFRLSRWKGRKYGRLRETIDDLDRPEYKAYLRQNLLLLALSFALIGGLIVLMTVDWSLGRSIQHIFATTPLYLLLVVGLMLVELFVLERTGTKRLTFSVALLSYLITISVFFVGLEVISDSNIAIVCCIQLVIGIYTIAMTATIPNRHTGNGLIGWPFSAFVAFVLVVVGTGVTFAIHPDRINGQIYGISVVIQFLLLVWIAYDSTKMLEYITTAESLQSVYYFHLDIFIFLVKIIINITAITCAILTIFGVLLAPLTGGFVFIGSGIKGAFWLLTLTDIFNFRDDNQPEVASTQEITDVRRS